MLKFDYKRKDGREDYYVIINDTPYYNSSYYGKGGCYLSEEDAINSLFSYSLSEVGMFLNTIGVTYEVEWWPMDIDMSCQIYSSEYSQISCPTFGFRLNVEMDDWAALWSLKNFSEGLQIIIKNRGDNKIIYFQDDEDFVSNGFGIKVQIENLEQSINDVLDTTFLEVDNIIKETNQYLGSIIDNQSVISFFNFPDSIKGPCQQYLMYFAQFLKDLGINVETEIKEQAHSTLFKVTPNDKNEALDKIKEALEIYTNAPALNDLQFQNMNNGDIAFMQLQANVMHLKSQMMFANTALQMKDATIEALQLSNYQLKAMVVANREKGSQEADVIPGIVAVKKYDGKWFSVNLPEVLNRLKRQFNK
jgi:hypothetical protein